MDAGTNRPATTIDTSPIPAETSSFPDTGADHRVALGSGVTSGYHGATSSMTHTSLTLINLVRHVFFRFPILLLALWLLPPATLRAEEPLHDLVDRLIEAQSGGTLAERCSDAEFLRRAWIDLAGTIPPPQTTRAFLADSAPKKRERLIDRLLARPTFAHRMSDVFDVMLMQRRPKTHIEPAEWRGYLRRSFAANKPYNQLAREILSADGIDPDRRPAARFFLGRNGESTLLTRDVGRLFFGRDLQCAQCHDHPVISDYFQADYYGLNAFLDRSFVFEFQEVDYNVQQGTLSFPPGTTEQVILVGVKGDKRDEPDETLLVELSKPVGAVIADGIGVGTILDDDGDDQPAAKPPSGELGRRKLDGSDTRLRLTINDWKLKERDGGTDGLPFTVRLSKPSTETVTVDFVTRAGTADDGKDQPVTVAERATGQVTFKSVFADDKTHQASMRLPDGLVVEEPQFESGQEYVVKPEGTARPVPKFSRRQALARLATSGKSRAFNRNIVNRLWAVMMGRGLVHPLDLHHAKNPPTHPKLLEALADHFVAEDFNVRWFLGELALTRTYQRSSVAPDELSPEAAAAGRYTVGLLRPLTPEQLAASLLEATGMTSTARADARLAITANPVLQSILAAAPPGLANVFVASTVRRALDKDLSEIIDVFAASSGDTAFQATAQEALYLGNAKLVKRLLQPDRGRLTTRLAKIDGDTVLATELYLAVLSRRPSPDEAAAIVEYLSGRGDQRAVAIRELTWAVLTSNEFRFNH